MNLYRSSWGVWMRTRAKARAFAKQNGGTIEKIEVPNDPIKLADFLNGMEDRVVDAIGEAAALKLRSTGALPW